MQTAQEQRDASIISAVASGMSRQNPACWNVSIYAHHKHNVKAGFLAGEWGNCLLEAGSRYWQASAQLVWQIQSSVQMRGHCSRAHQRQFRASRASLLLRRFWFLLLVRCENLDSRSLLPSFLMILTIDLPIFRRVLFLAFLRWSTSCQDAATVASPKLLTSSRGRKFAEKIGCRIVGCTLP